ncbi:VWA domain-containing protein [Porticoccus sp. W117]|uniref:VWA domain-containing protein n=1 Tax=Porticoccus sp. W117 TaxID=3054777 RepID=UPI0025993072|nr:VWA domain-containing protein [Porticoccus sp. W117]MDM3870725.1 VWA domain-containing protein [Porticoccus sp. W117]
MKKKRSSVAEMNISFLDVISCGFGAIVLLLLIAKTVESTAFEESTDLDGSFKDLQKELFDIRGETTVINRQLRSKEEQLSNLQLKIARLQEQLASVEKQRKAVSQVDTTEEEELTLALQILTEEMERLLGADHKRTDDTVGGIPVDSEYVIFVVDTSGSMQTAWARVRREMINILDIYPQVKGIQVMNDQGGYMFSSYKNRWIEDTPTRRRAIVQRLNTWTPFSNSSPVEGIQKAIRSFYDRDKKISIYVFGDDYQGQSVRRVLDVVDRLNAQRSGQRLVRIHCVGFPVHMMGNGVPASAVRFANLMREMSYRNGGTFVGLNGLN